MDHLTNVMEDASTAPQAPTNPATPEVLGLSIEAILLTVDRPVPAARLAEALGLTPPAPQESDAAAVPDSAISEPKPRRRSRAKGASNDAPSAMGRIEAAVADLNRQYEATGRAFRIEAVAGGYRVMTLPALAPVLAAYHKTRASSRLSRAAIETLAVIAYKQPITRAHLEAIRGVSCGEVLRSLLDRRLITIKGRAEELGRPILYGTTKEFLDAFGLASLKDLPSAAELQLGA
jgi:segregation and condensation protein B